MRSHNVEGRVQVAFVVGTMGRANTSTFKVLQSSHELFANAVRSALRTYRFNAASIGGRRVKQLVIRWFDFKPNR